MAKYQPTRRSVMQATAALGLGLGTQTIKAVAANQPKSNKKPNILFVLSDQHRHDAIGAAGDPVVQTPILDGLAREGAFFKRMWCQSPVCRPARAAIITGRYPHENSIAHNSDPDFDTNWPTMMKNLQKSGYATASLGKTDYRGNKGDRPIDSDLRTTFPFIRSFGFDYVSEDGGLKIVGMENFSSLYVDYLRAQGLFERYAKQMNSSGDEDAGELWEPIINDFEQAHDITSFVARQAIAWLEQRDTSKPFYLTFSPIKPHGPLAADFIWAAYYKDKDMPLGPSQQPKLGDDVWSKWLAAHLRASNSAQLDEDYLIRCKRIYYAMISLVDQKIGEIMDVLRKRGELDNTWIIYSADHGDMMGDHKFMNKEVFYDSSVSVPAIIRPPLGQPARVIDQPVEAIDLTATILDIAGAEPLPTTGAQSLLPYLSNPSLNNIKTRAFSEISDKKDTVFFVAVTDEEYRYTVEAKSNTPCELFNLREDPQKNNNLVADPGHAKTVARMQNDAIKPHLGGKSL